MLFDFLGVVYITVWIAIIIAIPTLFLSEFIIDLLYGESYRMAAPILSLHIWTGIFIFMGIVSNKWFVAENLQIYSFYRTLLGVSINILLNYILIPKYGIIGAAIATLISQIFASYIFNLTNIKLRHIFILQTNAFLLPLRKFGVKFG